MPLVELHEEDEKRRMEPVFINPAFVTFIQKSPTSSGTIIGLVGDDLGCVVHESVKEVARLVLRTEERVELVADPPELSVEETNRLKDVVTKWTRSNADTVRTVKPAEPKEADEVRKPRKARKWHSRKPFNKEAKETDNGGQEADS